MAQLDNVMIYMSELCLDVSNVSLLWVCDGKLGFVQRLFHEKITALI